MPKSLKKLGGRIGGFIGPYGPPADKGIWTLDERITGGFDPASIGGLAFWLDASDASTITTVSGQVSEWRSRVGGGFKAEQTSAANRPAYTLGGRNGRNVVTFDGSEDANGDFLLTSTLSISQPYTMVWAGRSNGRLPNESLDGPFVCDGGPTGNRAIIGWNSSGTIGDNGRLFMFASAAVDAPVGETAYNEWAVVTAVFNGASSVLRANGSQVASGNPGANAIGSLTLGSRFNTSGAPATFFEGPWGTFLVYSNVLSASEIIQVERYLARLWGVTLT